jgi:hypothetical protein
VQEIIHFCEAKIAGWLTDVSEVRTIAELEILVCKKLHVVFEEVWSDAELEKLIKKYVALGKVFSQAFGMNWTPPPLE